MYLTRFLNHPNYWWGCESLADALWQIRDRQQAIASLEECTQNDFKNTAAWAPLGYVRSSVDLHLADLYRQVGNLRAAETTEARVRARLVLADADYPLLVELNRRK